MCGAMCTSHGLLAVAIPSEGSGFGGNTVTGTERTFLLRLSHLCFEGVAMWFVEWLLACCGHVDLQLGD